MSSGVEIGDSSSRVVSESRSSIASSDAAGGGAARGAGFAFCTAAFTGAAAVLGLGAPSGARVRSVADAGGAAEAATRTVAPHALQRTFFPASASLTTYCLPHAAQVIEIDMKRLSACHRQMVEHP